tara:strand:- start:307 stop:3441 length:3135 start_codon:yes stop_codon:yes gene_type:complete
MPYEIPQELEYKEKILFGLTAGQLGYALIFLPIALLLFFKTGLSLPFRIFLTTIPTLIGLLFMFCNFKNTLLNWKFFFSFRKASLQTEKMKQFIPVQNIEKSVVEVKEGKKIKKAGILQVTPLNFSIKNMQERNAIIAGFQRFLDGLDFRIQVVMGTDTLNLDLYLGALQSRVETTAEVTGNEDYLNNFEDYKKHLEETIGTNAMMNRTFFLIIPEVESIGLEIQLSVCQEKLSNLNLETKRLDKEELIQTLASFFKDLLKDEEHSAYLLDAGEQDVLHCLIAPQHIENHVDYIKVDDFFCRVLTTAGYPRVVEAGFLDRIVTCKGNFDVSLHIEPFAIETIMVNLNRELQKQRADLFSAESKGAINPSLEIKYTDTRNVLENLQKGSEKLFNVSFYINCKAKTLEELNLLTKKLESELSGLMMIPRRASFQMSQGLRSCIPLGFNDLGIKRNITTKALSAFFPFTSQFLEVDEQGVWFGMNTNDVPIVRDIFSLTNPNGLILATSGSGKSYFAKLFISRHLLNGTRVIVIDPQGEYSELCKKFNGQLITISRSSELIINPLDLMGHDYDEKRMTLIDLMRVMLGEISDIQKAVLDKALTNTYSRKGITNDPKTWKNKPPILQDLLYELMNMSRGASVIEKPTYQSLLNRLSMYVDGVFSFLNKHTKFDFDNFFVCFNIGDMPKQVKPVIMFLVLDFVYMKMKSDKERKLLIVDEAWSLLGRAEDASYIFEIVKTSRKFNLGLLLITQDVADLVGSDAGHAVLANSSFTLLLRQKPSAIENLVKAFQLSFSEKENLLVCGKGEGILLIENEHTELKIVASDKEHDIITTNPEELKLKPEKKTTRKEKGKDVHVKLNPDKGFFKRAELSSDDIRFLLSHGYIVSSHVGLGGGQRKDYLLKPKGVSESPKHFFLVKALEEFVKTFTDKVELFHSVKPDIVFVAKGKKWAVEVETGSHLDKAPSKLKEKVKSLNRSFGNRWFFVVTNAEYAYKYKEFGKVYTRKNVESVIRRVFFPPKFGKVSPKLVKKKVIKGSSKKRRKTKRGKK